MATSAFKSSTRRSSLAAGELSPADAGSSNRGGENLKSQHRRSRSLSRYSDRFPVDEVTVPSPAPVVRGRFVNTERGSGFPEVSLDDLANEFFLARDWEEELDVERRRSGGRTGGRRFSDAGFAMETESSRRRGRSVSRKDGDEGSSGHSGSNKSGGENGNIRRRRSVSVARRRFEDTEGDINFSHNSSSQSIKQGMFITDHRRQPSSLKKSASNHLLRRSSSKKDLQQSHDSYSSQSSSLTDDEARAVHSGKTEPVKTIKAVYAQKKADHPTIDGEVSGLYQAMHKEVKDAVEEIRIELEKVMVKTTPSMVTDDGDTEPDGSDFIQAIAEIKRNYTGKLEESEKRRQKLLAELAAEEYRGQELTKLMRGLLPETRQNKRQDRPLRGRKRSNDKTRISKRLTEEAEKYFEDFILNVEDTDLSSFDGEKSDTSSTLGYSIKSREPVMHVALADTQEYLSKAFPLPVDTDGVVLPWLQWETNSDLSLAFDNKSDVKSGNNLNDTMQEARSVHHNSSNLCASSPDTWSPNCNGGPAVKMDKKGCPSTKVRNNINKHPVSRGRCDSFEMSEYIKRQRDEDLLFEIYKQRQRIDSGSLIFCRRSFGSY